jgi:hypothetical protein
MRGTYKDKTHVVEVIQLEGIIKNAVKFKPIGVFKS